MAPCPSSWQRSAPLSECLPHELRKTRRTSQYETQTLRGSRGRPGKSKIEIRNPSACRSGRWKSRRRVSAVLSARSEYFRFPPRRLVGLAFQLAMPSGESQTEMLPRWTSERSYSDHLPTRHCVLYFGWTRHRVIGMARSSWERMRYRPIEPGHAHFSRQRPTTGG